MCSLKCAPSAEGLLFISTSCCCPWQHYSGMESWEDRGSGCQLKLYHPGYNEETLKEENEDSKFIEIYSSPSSSVVIFIPQSNTPMPAAVVELNFWNNLLTTRSAHSNLKETRSVCNYHTNGINHLSIIERLYSFRGKMYYHYIIGWYIRKCPLFRVSFIRGSTVHADTCIAISALKTCICFSMDGLW